jgi:hypothetical protein
VRVGLPPETARPGAQSQRFVACSSGYPVLGDIPWLFPDPRQALDEWRGRLSLLNQHLESESKAKRAEAAATATATTRARLEFVANAHQEQVRRLGERSMRDMAKLLVDQRLMSAEEAEAQVRLFLRRLHEESESA